jgi:hypothetical protein
LSFSKPLSTCGRIFCNSFCETFVWRGIIPKWCSSMEGLTYNSPAVSEFMSQKLESITLHGIVKERWGNGGSP